VTTVLCGPLHGLQVHREWTVMPRQQHSVPNRRVPLYPNHNAVPTIVRYQDQKTATTVKFIELYIYHPKVLSKAVLGY